MKTFKDLKEFIQSAEKSRKYLPVTVSNLKAPLRLLDTELTEEEKNSVDLIKQHLDEIFNLIFSKTDNLSADSIIVYKRRIHNLISDYEKYGDDPAKMAAWDRNPQPRKLKEKRINGLSKKKVDHLEESATPSVLTAGPSVEVGEFSLILPNDWDITKTRQAIARGDFKTIYDELTKLSTRLKKTGNEIKDLDLTRQG